MSMEDDLNCGGPSHDILEGKNISKPREQSCVIVAKTGSCFLSYSKNLPEAKLKSLRLMALAGISRQLVLTVACGY